MKHATALAIIGELEMEYLDKAANSIDEAKTEQKLDMQLEELENLVKDYDLTSVQPLIARAKKETDFDEKACRLYKVVQELDDIASAIHELSDTLPDLMDDEEEKAYEAEQEAEAERIHDLGGITFQELEDRFCKLNRDNASSESAVIVFKPESSPDNEYTEEERSYRVSSDNKMFKAGMNGYSLFGECLATNEYERLDYRMRGFDGPHWVVDYCRIEA